MCYAVDSDQAAPLSTGAVVQRLVTRFFTRFSLQSTAGMSENSGTDARFPYERRQNVVIGLVLSLLLDQERPFAESFAANSGPHAR